MRINHLHYWNLDIKSAIEIQNRLSRMVTLSQYDTIPSLIAGMDVSVKMDQANAAAVILSYPELEVLEIKTLRGAVDFPYIPGLLSFREIPLMLSLCENLSMTPDLVFVDGQGIAHPRHLGLASHLGLFLDVPTIGCAKSPLYGEFTQPGEIKGNYGCIREKSGENLGAVLRTKNHVKPLFISPGHKIDIQSSINWVLNCCRGYRLPEPTRLAHLASKGIL